MKRLKYCTRAALVIIGLVGAMSASAATVTVTITAPTNNQVLTAPASITVSASTKGTGIKSVDFYQGTTLIGTDTTSPYSITWSNVAAGSYSLTAKAKNSSGTVVATSSTVAIVVDAPPTVSVTAPTANQGFATGSSITLSATAADADGTVSKVDFYRGSTLIGTATTAPYTVTWSNAATGSYSLTAKATDNRNVATTSAAVPIVVAAPPTVSMTSPTANKVFGANAWITLTASAAASTGGTIAKVDFYHDGVSIGTSTTSPYSVTWSRVPPGNYTITAVATDSRGLATTSAGIPIVVNAAPTISLTSPVANQAFAAGSSITLNATAASTGSTVQRVDFYQSGTLIGSSFSAPYTVTWSNVTAGSYSLTANVTDNLGAVTVSTAVPIVVAAAPTVSLTSPGANQVFKAPAAVPLTATASASTGGSISKVDYYQGTTLVGTATTPPYSFTWSNAPAGNYSLTAKATDSLGLATTSTAVPIVVNSPPTVSLTSPTANQVFGAPATITVTATAGDADGSVAKVDFYQGTTLIGTATSAPYSITWSNVATGSYTLTAIATDNRGTTTTSAVVSIIVDTPPTVSITSPASNQVIAGPANITLTANATSGGTITKVEFFQGATLVGTATTTPYTITWSNVTAGTYSLTAKATDGLGFATTSAPVQITVDAPPIVTLTSPTAGTVAFFPASFTLTATASSPNGTITKVDFYQGTTLVGTGTASPFSVTWSNVAAGNYSLTAVATDALGVTTTSSAINVTVMVNNAPTISLISPTNGENFTGPAMIVLTANAADPDNNLATVAFYNGAALLTTLTGPPYTYPWVNVPQGTYTLTAVATDALGVQTVSSPATITVGTAEAGLYYIHTDHLNTPRLVTDSSNSIVWRNLPTTEPFGNSPPETDPNNTGNSFVFNLRFPGQYFDSESNLNYNYSRDYDPSTGRYVQSDPIGLAGGINTYAYVEGNPISYKDPKGLLKQCKSGLNALGGKQVGPLHHEFSCWKNKDGTYTCKGYGRDPNSSAIDAVLNQVPGKVLTDGENYSSDTTCDDDDNSSCMDRCVADLYAGMEKNPPPYSWTRDSATQCQAANRNVTQTCMQMCAARGAK